MKRVALMKPSPRNVRQCKHHKNAKLVSNRRYYPTRKRDSKHEPKTVLFLADVKFRMNLSRTPLDSQIV